MLKIHAKKMTLCIFCFEK